MTGADANAALERIERIVQFGSEPAPMAFSGESLGVLDGAWARLETELQEAAEALRAFARTEDSQVGTVLTDWTGDMYCVWAADTCDAERRRHLDQFQRDFTGRLRAGYLLAALVRAAVTLSRLAAAPLTVVSAGRAAWDLVIEVQEFRASMEAAGARTTRPVS